MKKIKKRKNNLTKFIYTIILIIITTIIIMSKVKNTITPVLYKYAEIETKKFSNYIINQAISKNITKNVTNDELFIIKENSEGEIKTIDFNTIKINKYLTKTTKTIEEDLKNIEKGNIYKLDNIDDISKKYNKNNLKKGIIFFISSGIIFNNPIFSNLGPKIPIKISLTGDVISYISANVEDYGINNSIIKVYINLEITESIIMPFSSKDIKMKAQVPIGIKMITGKIPDFYYGNMKTNKITNNWQKTYPIIKLKQVKKWKYINLNIIMK